MDFTSSVTHRSEEIKYVETFHEVSCFQKFSETFPRRLALRQHCITLDPVSFENKKQRVRTEFSDFIKSHRIALLTKNTR